MSLREIDEQLVDGIRDRSDTAFTIVYQLLASDLVSYAFGMLRDRGAAEDAVQQAFLELSRAAPTIEGDGRSLRAWLYRSVRFSCLDEIRRRKRHPEEPTERIPDPGIEDAIELPEPELHAALMALSERQRSVVVLRYMLDASFDDIARIMGSNRTAMYATCARAERRLERLLRIVEFPTGAASEPAEGERTVP